MFFTKIIKKELLLEPQYLGPQLKSHVSNTIKAELEGRYVPNFGYVISVFKLEDENIFSDNALIDNDSGGVNLACSCKVIVLRVFKNEVLDAVVHIADRANGIFAKVGPLEIYVSKLSIPKDMAFDENRGDRWIADNGETEIVVGTVVRLRVSGVCFGIDGMSAVGSINEADLGVIPQSSA
jgi:DNA-directed RNA polymerase subunit E'/Rpb7